MVESAKYLRVNGGRATISDYKSISPFYGRSTACAYASILAFLGFTLFIVFNPTVNITSPWFTNVYATTTSSTSSYKYHFSSFIFHFFPNSSHSTSIQLNITSTTSQSNPSTSSFSPKIEPTGVKINSNKTIIETDQFEIAAPRNPNNANSSSLNERTLNQTDTDSSFPQSLMKCDLFDGNWVKDDSYPLYNPGSCSLIDEQFNCFLNSRPDKDYTKLKWKPRHCTLPRLNASHMLDILTGKRLVFIGDSLNRNMWESLVCILRNSVKDQSNVYEAYGRQYFRTDASYSFIFKDYNCSIELFVSPFLVQEWELKDKNGVNKETLRLDLIGKSSDQYKSVDIIIFNTGHWWTHEKTSKGQDYYQEGSHVYSDLNVEEAFRRALTTWGRWVDRNINPNKTLVFFRGYSPSHFSGGRWNSGGQCDRETKPIKNDTYLLHYPTKMKLLESVLMGMRTPVAYLNITRMTDYRKDGHPSIYRKQNLSSEQLKSSLMYQDCSHWCLPGVPDIWNELLYAELLIRYGRQ